MIKQILKKYSDYFAIMPASVLSKERGFLQNKIAKGIPQHMSYLERNPNMRVDIKQWFPQTKSIILILFPYWNSKMSEQKTIMSKKSWLKLRQLRGNKKPPVISDEHLDNLKDVKLARYTLSRDYHEVVGNILKEILLKLKESSSMLEGKIFVDSSPVMEKALSQKAGLGNIGKNMILINKEIGSYFFIGGIAVSEDLGEYLSTQKSPQNLCDICDDKCIKACPNNALSDNGLDYEKCFSCWNTQTKTSIPKDVEKKMTNLVEGCDICQQVCPYNQKTECKILEGLKPMC